MAAMAVVEIFKAVQLSPQVTCIPEEYTIQIFSPDCADQSFHKRMRYWHVRHGLDFRDLEYPKIGLPAMEAEQRIVIGAEISR